MYLLKGNYININNYYKYIQTSTYSAINYRNVSDYIAKSGMRRNCKWGTDVEIFAAALLFKTDIWVFNSVIGGQVDDFFW